MWIIPVEMTVMLRGTGSRVSLKAHMNIWSGSYYYEKEIDCCKNPSRVLVEKWQT